MLNPPSFESGIAQRTPAEDRGLATAADVRPVHKRGLDPESQAWLARLHPQSPDRPAAVGELRTLLLRAAGYELNRRAGHLRGSDHADLADQSANDALLAILRKLQDFRGDSRFTTWAYKFALYEAAVKVRRLSWQGRELVLEEPQQWTRIADGRSTSHDDAETSELLAAVGVGIRTVLSPHQREVLVAITLNDVPIDILAERLSTTRGALYKTLHDARRKLRGALAAQGLGFDDDRKGDTR